VIAIRSDTPLIREVALGFYLKKKIFLFFSLNELPEAPSASKVQVETRQWRKVTGHAPSADLIFQKKSSSEALSVFIGLFRGLFGFQQIA